MSRTAIAAALALDSVTGGERLVAFALASFANRDQLAWPGTPLAAARAGLARSRYLDARRQLCRRGLIETVQAGGGRGRSTTLLLRFAAGPRVDGPVNAELFETVLSYSGATGPARLLLASIAALADEDGQLDGVTAEELCAAAGLAASTYRRARKVLIAASELALVRGLGGRGHTNCWRIPDPRRLGRPPAIRAQRRPPAAPARPLMAPVAPALADLQLTVPAASSRATRPLGPAVEGARTALKGAQDRTVSAVKGAQDRTVSALKGAQDRTVSPPALLETQPEREPKREPRREPRNAHAGKEPGNPRTGEHPPNPPEGGRRGGDVFVEESYVTERGRKRKRLIRVDVNASRRALKLPSSGDREAWLQARALMLRAIGESTFDIWLSQLELVAVDPAGLLVITGAEATLSWVQKLFGQLISRCCEGSGRRVRFASPQEQLAIENTPDGAASAGVREQPTINRRVS
jgi:hypothetical protein